MTGCISMRNPKPSEPETLTRMRNPKSNEPYTLTRMRNPNMQLERMMGF